MTCPALIPLALCAALGSPTAAAKPPMLAAVEAPGIYREVSLRRHRYLYRSADICERHRMQKVFTLGGRSWRCRRVRDAALRVPQMRGEKLSSAVPQDIGVRVVRTIGFFHGMTPSERIERAFDKLWIFPVEDEP